MFYYILLIFVALPIAELTLLKLLWDATSLTFTIGLVLLTGVIGASLAKMQGLSAWQRIHRSMAEGRPPAQELLDGVLILIAGAVLITPGMITDVVGFSLLVPQLRSAIGTHLAAWFRKRTLAQFTPQAHGATEQEPTVIDAEFTRVETDDAG